MSSDIGINQTSPPSTRFDELSPLTDFSTTEETTSTTGVTNGIEIGIGDEVYGTVYSKPYDPITF